MVRGFRPQQGIILFNKRDRVRERERVRGVRPLIELYIITVPLLHRTV